jgi:hypothetical protein
MAKFEGALAILRPGTDDWIAPVLAVSAQTNRTDAEVERGLAEDS